MHSSSIESSSQSTFGATSGLSSRQLKTFDSDCSPSKKVQHLGAEHLRPVAGMEGVRGIDAG